MKLTVLQSELSKLLTLSTHFVSSRAQLPILGNVVLKGERNRLFLQATNLEISLSTSIGAQIEEEGSIAVPAKSFSEIITALSNETIILESSTEVLNIEAGGFSGKLVGMNTADFPTIPQTIAMDGFTLDSSLFKRALDQILFAVSKDESRPVLTGVLAVFEKNSVTFVASDGVRLSQKKIVTKGESAKKSVIVPRLVLTVIQRMLEQNSEILFEYKESDNQVIFGIENSIIGSRVIEGDFPNFERIVPKLTKIKVSLSKDDFKRAIKIASVYAREAANTIKLLVNTDSVTVTAESSAQGKQKTEIDADVTGGQLEISYNWRFLDEFLAVSQGESVSMEFNDQNAPGIFRDPTDPDLLHLIMPVKL